MFRLLVRGRRGRPALLLVRSADWPVFRGDALMTGVGTAKLPDQLEVKWTFKTGEARRRHRGRPRRSSAASSTSPRSTSTSTPSTSPPARRSGRPSSGAMKASPGVKGGRVYVGDLDGMFYCVNAADGKVLWKFETERRDHGRAPTSTATTSSSARTTRTLYCLDAGRQEGVGGAGRRPGQRVAAVVGDRDVRRRLCDSILHVIDAKTGKELGTVDLGGQAVATAAVVGRPRLRRRWCRTRSSRST